MALRCCCSLLYTAAVHTQDSSIGEIQTVFNAACISVRGRRSGRGEGCVYIKALSDLRTVVQQQQQVCITVVSMTMRLALGCCTAATAAAAVLLLL